MNNITILASLLSLPPQSGEAMPWRATGGRRWWDRPVLPYLVLSVSPVATLLIGRIILFSLPVCVEADYWWELRHFELALLPALLDFLPFLWLVSGTRGVRGAAIVAGLIGSARYAILQAATLFYSAPSGEHYGSISDCPGTISIFFVLWLVPLMLALWLGSALIAAVIVLRARERPN